MTMRKTANSPTSATNRTRSPTKNFSRKPGICGQNDASHAPVEFAVSAMDLMLPERRRRPNRAAPDLSLAHG